MPTRNDDPLWRSAGVRAALLWLLTSATMAIGGAAWSDHERAAETRQELALVRLEVQHLSESLKELREALGSPIASKGTAVPVKSP